MKRILAIDWGEKRIGLAISSEDRVFAYPYQTVENRGTQAAADEIRMICEKEDIGLLLVGLPLARGGNAGKTAEMVRAFAAALRERIAVSVKFEDERLTTQAAERQFNLRRHGRTDRKLGLLDQRAAQVLLEGYLERRRQQETSSPTLV